MSSEILSQGDGVGVDISSLKSAAARRFAEFCQQQPSTGAEDADPLLRQEAIRLILARFEQETQGASS